MIESFKKNRNKQRLMNLSFKACQICRGRGRLGLSMGRIIGLMGHM